VKYSIFIFNFLFAVVGLALIGLGAYMQTYAQHYLDFLNKSYANTPTIIIVPGVAVFVVAFFACCGACSESSLMVYTYSVIVAGFLVAQFGAGIAAFVLKGDVNDAIETKMVDGMVNYGAEGYDGVTDTWDYVQQELECCGVNNFTDWGKVLGEGRVPDSCCKVQSTGCGNAGNLTTSILTSKFLTSSIFTTGCLDIVSHYLVTNIAVIGVAVLSFAFVEMLVIILACCLGERIERQKI